MTSTDWKESLLPNEAKRHEQAAKDIVTMQQRKSELQGAGRALHRKQNLAARAKLVVHAQLPTQAAHGLFAKPGEYPVVVRLSNGSQDKAADKRPDIRGFAFRVSGLQGASALGGTTDHQDFLLINHKTFAFPTSELFTQLVLAAGQGQLALIKWVFATFGFFGGFKKIAQLDGMAKKPFSGFATEPFFSTLPFCCGPHACKLRVLPLGNKQPLASASNDWRADFLAHAAAGTLSYDVQLQFFVDETQTPIEDATVEWSEAAAPFVSVASLVVDSTSSDAAFEAQVEQGLFDPWHALIEHRPLGEVMRARKVIYLPSQQARGATSQ
jgi:hypothetical protein